MYMYVSDQFTPGMDVSLHFLCMYMYMFAACAT